MKVTAYYYHSVIVITFILAPSDNINRFQLYFVNCLYIFTASENMYFFTAQIDSKIQVSRKFTFCLWASASPMVTGWCSSTKLYGSSGTLL